MHQCYIVSNFYKFLHLNNIEDIKLSLKKEFKKIDLKGSFLLSSEGINGSFSVRKQDYELIKNKINNTFNQTFEFKNQNYKSHAFLRLKIRIKKEIVTIGDRRIKPLLNSGKYLSADDWESLISEKKVVLIDTRNHYESRIGSFKNSIKVNSNNFREFPRWFEKNKEKFKNKKIAMFCTGGIRCEKATNYVLNSGFERVYQLKGGIINYLKVTKNNNKFWDGDCFVFDDRVSVNKNLEKGQHSQCFACRSPITRDERLSKYYSKGISCPHCYGEKNQKQINKYTERKRQMKIAKGKGIKHLAFKFLIQP